MKDGVKYPLCDLSIQYKPLVDFKKTYVSKKPKVLLWLYVEINISSSVNKKQVSVFNRSIRHKNRLYN